MSLITAMARCEGSARQDYPEFPFAPDAIFPEFPADQVGPPNSVYAAVRRALYLLGLDRDHYGTAQWNPLGQIIRQGQRVLIKPNWVLHRNTSGGDVFSVITHPSVLRPVIDYVLLALKGQGRVIIGDAPIQSADFGMLMELTQVPRLLEYIPTGGVDIEVRDFRQNVCQLDEKGRILAHEVRKGDPDGYCTVDVGRDSLLCDVAEQSERFRVTNYDPRAMRAHHTIDRHEYLIAKAVLESDVVINVPKLKTHRKAGLTCCLKNVVGINGSKDYLPHHRVGPATQGGDEYRYPSLWKRLGSRFSDRVEASPDGAFRGLWHLAVRVCRRMSFHCARDPYSEGSWYGNDTIWRTILDLNRILRFARPDGTLAEFPQRRLFNVVDAVVVGGGEGPLRPTGTYAGIVLAGRSRAAVDTFAARLIGLDPQKIPLLQKAMRLLSAEREGQLALHLISDGQSGRELTLGEIQPVVRVLPPADWAGHVELECWPGWDTQPCSERPDIRLGNAEE